jgi:hypothetical protein
VYDDVSENLTLLNSENIFINFDSGFENDQE